MPFDQELQDVMSWVGETDLLALESFHVDAPFESKGDGTPVTEADRAIERRLREHIATTFPADAILGEEQGGDISAPRRWIIDPIDGTKNFIRGVPVFATLIALEQDGELVLGMVSAPALHTRWWATRGGGAWRDGKPIRVSGVDTLGDAHFTTGGLSYAREGWDALHRLSGVAARGRGFGDFWGHVLVAQGSQDVMVEFAPLAVWDVAAPKMIVTEAGGRWTDLDGKDVSEGPSISSNGHIHEQVLDALRDT